MKNFLFALLQFAVFLLVFAVGSLLGPVFLHLPSVVSTFANGTRGFQWDGIFLILALFAVLLIVETLSKRLRKAAPWTMLALLLATAVGLIMKFGFFTFDR